MANEAMREHWTTYGERWVRDRASLDAMLAPFLAAMLDGAAARPGEAILDIGCGAGTTTIALARRVAPGGRVVGVDVSAPLISELGRRAREAGEVGRSIQPLLADAQVDPLPGPFDVVTSRFGVMFFDDQDAAWRNIRGVARAGARLAFVCWQRTEDNPWSVVPALAALAVSPGNEPPPDPDAPGPSALADAGRTVRILATAGWRDAACTPIRVPITLGSDMPAALANVRGQSSVAGAIERAGEQAVCEAVAAALAPYTRADGSIQLEAAAWLVTARA